MGEDSGPARGEAQDPVAQLQRWEDAGAVWEVLSAGPDRATVSLLRCDGGEEMERITSTDPALLEFLAGRTSSMD